MPETPDKTKSEAEKIIFGGPPHVVVPLRFYLLQRLCSAFLSRSINFPPYSK